MTEAFDLDRLCDFYGIAHDYYDIWGNHTQVSAQSKQALLQAMGAPLSEQTGFHYEHQRWQRWLAPVQVIVQNDGSQNDGCENDSSASIVLSLADSLIQQHFSWTLTQENGEIRQGKIRPAELPLLQQTTIDEQSYSRYSLSLFLNERPDLGYHRLELLSESGISASMALIVCPPRCYQPEALHEHKLWGVALQLYALRSQRNWGIGDFTDLKQVIAYFAESGADAVGLNPLHALFPDRPYDKSPYSPSSRLFYNPLYLDIEAIADFSECKAAQKEISKTAFKQHLQQLRANERVDYEQVTATKMSMLQQLYEHFCKKHLHRSKPTARALAFRQFQQKSGQALRQHALYESLQHYFQSLDPAVCGWSQWLPSYRIPDSERVARFSEEHLTQVEFYEYLQWQIQLQLQAACEHAQQQGMKIGLYCDLAVGVNSNGAETWANQNQFALAARIGAPPDDFSPGGQDWGLPPLIPEQLQNTAYQLFIDTLRANMQYAGALRIDHVMGLLRLFWIPAGQSPAAGTYVSYPIDDLLGILALESQRNRCLVIGEDLGTVPDELRHRLYELGVLSYRVLYFEKDWQANRFKLPEEYPEQALATASTHDLPTLSGFWQKHDLSLRDQLDLFPSAEIREQQYGAREHDRRELLLALQQAGLATDLDIENELNTTLSDDLQQLLQIYLAKSPAQLMMLQLEDIFAQVEQVNLPGTVDQYPNWQRRLASGLESWPQDQTLRNRLLIINKARNER